MASAACWDDPMKPWKITARSAWGSQFAHDRFEGLHAVQHDWFAEPFGPVELRSRKIRSLGLRPTVPA